MNLDGIIVLGGAIDPDQSRVYGIPVVSEAADRITAAVNVGRQFPDARIIYTSGNPNLLTESNGEATYAKPLLETLGIRPVRIE